MKKIITLLLLAIGVVTLASCSPTPHHADDLYEVVYIHRSEESAQIMANNFNMELLNYSDYGVTTYGTRSETQYQSLLATMGFADNTVYEIAVTDDEYSKDQYNIALTNVDSAWNITTGNPDIIVAIVDTGVDIDHPELISSMHTTGYNAATGMVGLEHADDDQGHGTRVAGIIAADKNNGIGIAGVAPDITIMPIKANYAGTSSIRAAWAIDGILYAIDNGAHIINLSFGSTSYNALMDQAVKQAYDAGIVVLAAAGNSGTERYYYPASYEHAISVSSINSDSTWSFFSTYNDRVYISAPGSGMITTNNYGDYVVVSGTSFASPHVAGVVALLLSVYPDMTPAEVKGKLQETAVDAGEPGWDKYYGHGIVDAYAILASDMATVSFNTMGGTTMDTVRLVPGSLLTIDTEPIKEHHTFTGWYTDSSYINEWMNGSVVDNSMILYAKWAPVTYTLNFYNEGELVATEHIVYGSLATAPIVTRSGYTFTGWYTYRNDLYNFSVTPTEDLDLHSRWSVNSYSIIYLDGNGNVHSQYTYQYGATIDHDIPEGPIKDYYDFVGWIGIIPDTMPANNITLTPEYAKRIGIVYVTIVITIVYEDGTENVISIEVPQDQVDAIIAEYGNGVVIE